MTAAFSGASSAGRPIAEGGEHGGRSKRAAEENAPSRSVNHRISNSPFVPQERCGTDETSATQRAIHLFTLTEEQRKRLAINPRR
jgi:hypothetical protein